MKRLARCAAILCAYPVFRFLGWVLEWSDDGAATWEECKALIKSVWNEPEVEEVGLP